MAPPSEATYYSLLNLVARADSFAPALESSILLNPSPSVGYPLRAGDHDTLIGFVKPQLIPYMESHPSVFTVSVSGVRVNASLTTSEARTAAVEAVLREWRDATLENGLKKVEDKQMFLCLKGWRNERYCVHGSRSEGVIMQLERAAVGLLGVRAYGCHLNGYTRTPEGQVKMWIAKRSDTKQTYPGMLDNLVGGGLATTTNPLENIIKECGEEAGLDIAAAFKVVSTGVLCFFLDDSERGWVPDTEWVYDLELPSSFDPQPVDGEVQAFHLWDLETVKEHLHKGEFMNESALVVIDFLIRFGLVTAMNEPDYIEIVARMHRSLPQPGPRFGSK